jgi:hypothetical protein
MIEFPCVLAVRLGREARKTVIVEKVQFLRRTLVPWRQLHIRDPFRSSEPYRQLVKTAEFL